MQKRRIVISGFRHGERGKFFFSPQIRDHLSVMVKPMKIFSCLILSQKKDQVIVKGGKKLPIPFLWNGPIETLTFCGALCIKLGKNC